MNVVHFLKYKISHNSRRRDFLCLFTGCLENDDLENDDLENDDLENNDLENDDLENDDLENDDRNQFFSTIEVRKKII